MTLREIFDDMRRDPLGWLEDGLGMVCLSILIMGAFVVLVLVFGD